MGQRSHILVRVKGDKTINIANYYHWNYGERMVSRAAWGIEWVKEHLTCLDGHERELADIWDVNFDMGDIQQHSDLIREAEDWFTSPVLTFGDIGFEGDGGLCVLVDEGTIKYAFIHPCNDFTPKTAEEYMLSDIGADREIPAAEYVESYIREEKIKTSYNNNLRALKRYSLMTQDELDEFLSEAIK